MRHSSERGIALITTLLVMTLISALLVAFTVVVMSDQRYRFIDKDRGQAFYGASAGIEKLTADLGNTFLTNVAPTNAQILALTTGASQPVINRITYTAPSAPAALPASELSTYDCNNGNPPDGVTRAPVTVGGNGYTITFCANTANNNPTMLPQPKTITQGTYAGLYAMKTPYQLDVTAKTASGGDVHLSRTIEAVAIPVFQFGIFSDVDLAFNAAQAFAFGGRVHTNGNLYLSQGAGSTLTLSDKVTAYRDIVRAVLSNGNAIANNNNTGTVNMTKGGGTYRALADTEGSVQGGPGSAPTAGWQALSLATYKGYIKNGANGGPLGTGAKQLTLPLVAPGVGGSNIDLIRRPPQNESPLSIRYQERLFTKASIRVLLSDTAADITNISGIDNAAPPLSLEAGAGPYGPTPIAISPGPNTPVTNITAAVASGTLKTITMAATPAFFQAPGNLYVVSGVNTWTITLCNAKTGTTFTGCTVTLTGGAGNIPVGATITTCNPALPCGTQTTTTAATALGANRTLTVNSTMAFAPNTFWVNDEVATCSGYTAATLTGCTVNQNISANDKIQNFSVSPAGTSLLGGVIKIERQNAADSTWRDITPEILAWGIGGPSLSGSCSAADPSPNAILRLQRLADDAWVAPCLLTTSAGTSYWPNTLFDTREAYQRQVAPAGGNIKLDGVMHYVTIDAANLARWFTNTAPYAAGTGNQSKLDNGGFSVYISDRRNNRNNGGQETAEWGYEDYVNPASATGVPNGQLDAGEDVNADAQVDTYGAFPTCNGQFNAFASGGITCANLFYNQVGAFNPLMDLASTAAPISDSANITGVGRATVNRSVMFRRAIKLINGNNLVAWVRGLTIVSENPVYVHGDWNANGGWVNPDAATAVLADAVTVLSNAWNDRNSYLNPYTTGGRPRTATSWYRFAVLAGKGPLFPLPNGQAATFGTDGGAHGFLRFLEGNGPAPDTINFRGSMATLYYNRQANGIFKGVNGFVYGIPNNRNYLFDVNFLTPSLLPPLTPMFRDMNAVGFSQQLQPGK